MIIEEKSGDDEDDEAASGRGVEVTSSDVGFWSAAYLKGVLDICRVEAKRGDVNDVWRSVLWRVRERYIVGTMPDVRVSIMGVSVLQTV